MLYLQSFLRKGVLLGYVGKKYNLKDLKVPATRCPSAGEGAPPSAPRAQLKEREGQRESVWARRGYEPHHQRNVLNWKRGRERESVCEREEVTSPLPSTRPYTRLFEVDGIKERADGNGDRMCTNSSVSPPWAGDSVGNCDVMRNSNVWYVTALAGWIHTCGLGSSHP